MKPTPKDAEAFWAFADQNNDGQLTPQELKSSVNGCLRSQGKPEMSNSEICSMFLDITGQGADTPISKAKYMEEIMKDRRKELEDLFKHLDKDNSGTLSHSEVVALAKEAGLGPDAAKDIIASADTNHDGVISFEEFKKCTC